MSPAIQKMIRDGRLVVASCLTVDREVYRKCVAAQSVDRPMALAFTLALVRASNERKAA